MSNGLVSQESAAVLDQVITQGNLSALSPADRVRYYTQVCESIGLNPLTKPFDYINLNGKLTLYAKRDATDQLRKIHRVSVAIVSRESRDGVYVVVAKATLPDGRSDESLGAVNTGSLKGDALANAVMKAETKAKRRVTLSICGLGWLDETEVDNGSRPHQAGNGHVEVKAIPNDNHVPPDEAKRRLARSSELHDDILRTLKEAHAVPDDSINDEFIEECKAYSANTIKPALPLLAPPDREDVTFWAKKLWERVQAVIKARQDQPKHSEPDEEEIPLDDEVGAEVG